MTVIRRITDVACDQCREAPHECEDGWACEQHPARAFPHDDCAGPGQPCSTLRDIITEDFMPDAEVERMFGGRTIPTNLDLDNWPAWLPDDFDSQLLIRMGLRESHVMLRECLPHGTFGWRVWKIKTLVEN